MTDLSPAAQAVLDAGQQYATQAWSDATHQRFNLGIAAALRAAADEVVPDEYLIGSDYEAASRQFTRLELFAIADELEGAR